MPGYQVAHRWQAAQEVGGDLIDFAPLRSGNLGMVIADVSGKGIPAALYMVFARTLLRAAAFSGREPAAMLMRTNELIVADSTSDFFVTAYYALLDVHRHTLIYASAGHNLAFYAPADDGMPRALTTKGVPLGIVADAEIEQNEMPLTPGDVVLFYTDGVTEAMNAADEEFGGERLAEVLRALAPRRWRRSPMRLRRPVRDFVGEAVQHDDFALIVVKRVDSGADVM